ncbi:sorting nexin-8-like [Branchiostoma lanceolatum]|uniref:SNX8 protein n=1 Tax=Branchiostoma lanceolatum TaxID=7740 RepID=A0A8S4MNZ7_BRALA|nr:SNX8 [Branchiostoma lanceolatum]
MAAELSFGSVPALYREVYDIVCPSGQESRVDREMFVKLLMKSSLPKQTLSSIWDAVDNKSGYLTRNGLYKALALTAMAQQGKNIEDGDKILENFGDQELPRPALGDLTDLKTLSIKVRRERNPCVLGYRFMELIELDAIEVDLIPEKKGLILKHVEYEVSSRRYKSKVLRRYNDFVAFQELLLIRFPYRMVPRLPPKKMIGADREFIEGRRKSLRRFLNLVARHPSFSEESLLKFFLTFGGADMQHVIKVQFRGIPDEFVTSPLAVQAKDLVPMDTQVQFSNSRDFIRILFNSIAHIKGVSDRMVARSTGLAADMLIFGKELSVLANDPPALSSWACGTIDTWSHLQNGFKGLSVEFGVLADKSQKQGHMEDDCLVEQLQYFLDLLTSYKDLCDRHEKGVLSDHQRALQKMGQMKKRKMTATIQGKEQTALVEQLESRIIEQESEINNMENRNYFSLHCVHMETQLIHANMELLVKVMEGLLSTQVRGHQELAQMWENIAPKIKTLIPPSAKSPSTSPATSPMSETAPSSFR